MIDEAIEHYITKTPRLGPIDATIVYPSILVLLYPRPITFYALFVCLCFLWYLSRKGVTASMFVRILKRAIVGSRKMTYPEIRKEI